MSNNLSRPEATAIGSQKVVKINESQGILDSKMTTRTAKALVNGLNILNSAEAKTTAFYRFTGALSAAAEVRVPSSPGFYWCIDETTGGQDVEVAALLGASVILDPDVPTLLYYDGTDVLQFIPTPP